LGNNKTGQKLRGRWITRALTEITAAAGKKTDDIPKVQAVRQQHGAAPGSLQAMITEREFYDVLTKHPNVKAAFEKAINAKTNAYRGAEKPGLWAKVRLARLHFDDARAMNELIRDYIVFMAAKNPGRAFQLELATLTGAQDDMHWLP
jgi:hypothetical protein